MRGMLQLQICSLETATNKKIALVCLTEDVLRGCVQLSKHNTSEGQIGTNKVIRAVEPTRQNATLGRARESLSTEEILGGDVNEKRGPSENLRRRHSRQKAEQVWMLRGEAASCGRRWKKVWVLSNQSGDEAGRRNMGGKAPTVGQDTVDIVLCCRG